MHTLLFKKKVTSNNMGNRILGAMRDSTSQKKNGWIELNDF